MCSIFTVLSETIPEETIRKCFDETISRGPDMSRLIRIPGGWMGFHRLAIMGPDERGMQPFEMNGDYAVCNGELYGFRPIRERLMKTWPLVSGSDCEIILPLYYEYGMELFRTLDAEFAMIIYEHAGDRIIAARDPIGIRPLYYGTTEDGAMAFASEPKNLTGLCETIRPFPPGHYWTEDTGFVQYYDPASISQFTMKEEDAVCAKLRRLLIDGVEKRLDADMPVGFLLSGGLDSSLVCAIAQKLTDHPIRTFAIGMDTDAIDLKYARIAADYIGSDHTEVIITKKDAVDAVEEVVKLLGTWDITTVRASIGMYLVCKYIHEHTDIRVLLTGEISDELFGYKYTDFAPDAEEFQLEAEKRIRELHMYDVLRADRCISVNSLEARVPFGDLKFVRYAMSIDPVLKMNRHGIGKYLLRKAFEDDHILPDEILWRQKAAFSDAVGHSLADELRAYAESVYSDQEFEERCAQYTYCPPFTKESLLYRDLFEKYYPGNAEMICDFWMPNRNWEGCNVNDPSARVLSNYGASGV